MKRLLIVHHSPSQKTQLLTNQVVAGASTPEILGVEVVQLAALDVSLRPVINADAYLLGTPANLGYMSGAMKHFFDVIYNDALTETAGRPFGFWIHGNTDTEGARIAIEKVTTGLEWRLAQEPLQLIGDPTPEHLDSCWDLGAAMAALLSQ